MWKKANDMWQMKLVSQLLKVWHGILFGFLVYAVIVVVLLHW